MRGTAYLHALCPQHSPPNVPRLTQRPPARRVADRPDPVDLEPPGSSGPSQPGPAEPVEAGLRCSSRESKQVARLDPSTGWSAFELSRLGQAHTKVLLEGAPGAMEEPKLAAELGEALSQVLRRCGAGLADEADAGGDDAMQHTAAVVLQSSVMELLSLPGEDLRIWGDGDEAPLLSVTAALHGVPGTLTIAPPVLKFEPGCVPCDEEGADADVHPILSWPLESFAGTTEEPDEAENFWVYV